jgi:hypothetical protein
VKGEGAVGAGQDDAMNRQDPFPPAGAEAQIRFLDGDFRILRPGSFVRCAVTGTPIPLDELRYWSVDLQEASRTTRRLTRAACGK